MRDAVGGVVNLVIIVVFLVIVSGYLAFNVNYTKAFRVKNKIISTIEEYEGINGKSLDKINRLMTNTHTVRGSCPSDSGGIIGSTITDASKSPGPYDVCVTRSVHSTNGVEKYYYSTTIFFSFSLPVLGNLYSFKIPGETMGMRYVTDTFFT